MRYVQPFDEKEPNAPYIDENIAAGIEGSCVPAAAIEHPMREIVHCITKAGLVPDENDLTQLYRAIEMTIQEALPDKYTMCEFYYFRHPDLKPGFEPAHGGLLSNAAAKYPAAWAYLQTAEGQKLCTTEQNWQAMTRATWATLADGTKVGWDGIGGAPFFAPDWNTGALRLPDLRGMYAEAAGFDSLGVGGVHGDAVRRITGGVDNFVAPSATASGAHYLSNFCAGTMSIATTGTSYHASMFDSSRVVPTASKVQPRAWGALTCVYLGAPK